jgi:hypothetical protein
VELGPPTNQWAPPHGRQPMVAPPEDAKAVACPCGEELIEPPVGKHVVGPGCRARIERHVSQRFGTHRFGGRFSRDVEDIVQECYEKLARPGGLDSFRPQPPKPLANAFRSWLSGVVRNHCNNKRDYIHCRPDLDGDPLDGIPEPTQPRSPQHAFALECLLDLARGAVADVEPRWRAKGADWSERFDVFLPFALQEDDDYERARRRLGISCELARQLKFTLRRDIREAARARVRDELSLEPGLSHEAIEARIDQAIETLLADAFPSTDSCNLAFLKPDPDAKLERSDAPSESKP